MAPELPLAVGDERTVETGRIAHGGHVIAHSDGRTLLVRHALPDETVRIVVTSVNRRVVRADAVEVLRPSPDRVTPPCPWARPGECGGCDFQHAALPAQRRLKSAVLHESLTRFGGVRLAPDDAVVEELPAHPDGLRWRTRMRWSVAGDGRLGLRAHRSRRIVPVSACLIAARGVDVADLGGAPRDTEEVVAAVGSDGRTRLGDQKTRQVVDGREWAVRASSFWQVHPSLPEALQETVLAFAEPTTGETWWDLYCGAGLLSVPVAHAVGAQGAVEAVDSSPEGIREARRAVHDLAQVRLHQEDVCAWLRTRGTARPAGVVLDPPRTGAGESVIAKVAAAAPATVVYVACDPVALARDVALLGGWGYRLERIRAFDAFPMTHHFETVARLVLGPHRQQVGDGIS